MSKQYGVGIVVGRMLEWFLASGTIIDPSLSLKYMVTSVRQEFDSHYTTATRRIKFTSVCTLFISN
jgi:hypothetical protein